MAVRASRWKQQIFLKTLFIYELQFVSDDGGIQNFNRASEPLTVYKR